MGDTGLQQKLTRRRQRGARQELAVLLHHRGLIHQKLENVSQAAADLQRAQELGYSPADGVW